MSYLQPYIDADGIHVPSYDDILQNLISNYKTIFGEDIVLDPETPDYQTLSVFAKSIDDTMCAMIDCYNSRSPNLATGDSLDILVELNGITRRAGTASIAELTLGGRAGTEIPAGSKVVDGSGHLWSTTADATLGEEGTATVYSHCDTLGAIEADEGTIVSIYTTVDGWTSVTNLSAAVPGSNAESDSELRLRRKKSIALKGSGLYDSLISSLNAIEEMSFSDVLVNDSGTTDSNGVPAHSICVLVYGKNLITEEDVTAFKNKVAEAIWRGKAPGVGTYGSTTVSYVDSQGHTNSIKFTIPTKTLVSVTVNLTALPNYDESRVEPMIKQAIMDEINNLGVGTNWNVTMAYKDIYVEFDDENCPFVVTSVTGKVGEGDPQTVTVPCDYDEILYVTEESITINVSE